MRRLVVCGNQCHFVVFIIPGWFLPCGLHLRSSAEVGPSCWPPEKRPSSYVSSLPLQAGGFQFKISRENQ